MNENTTIGYVITGYLMVCLTIGLAIGSLGFGLGLVWLTVQQAIGIAVAAFGCGVVYGFTFGAASILKPVIAAVKQTNEDTQCKAPTTRPPVTERT